MNESSVKFDYNKAFSRNLGFVTKEEQVRISQKVIAIPGLGGVGGHHLHSLVRLGFKRFHISDFDEFDVHNFNRQIGAKMSTVGKSKLEVMHEMLLDIIPDAEVKLFPEGVNETNREAFLEGVDFVIDALDVYVIRERIKLYDLAKKMGIHIITGAPLGMSTSVFHFDPNKMSFNKYFDINEEMSDGDLLAHFVAGLSPWPYHYFYLNEDDIDMAAGKAPSLHVGVLIATSIVSATVLKLTLRRGKVYTAPRSLQVDLYTTKVSRNWGFFGNKNPWQKIIIFIAKHVMKKKN